MQRVKEVERLTVRAADARTTGRPPSTPFARHPLVGFRRPCGAKLLAGYEPRSLRCWSFGAA